MDLAKKNAKLFQWESDKKIHYPLRRRADPSISTGTGKGAHELTIEDLAIPAFVVYEPIDEQEEKYRTEREKCYQIYKNQDFCELTVGFLKGIQPKKEEKTLSKEAQELIRQCMGYNSTFSF